MLPPTSDTDIVLSALPIFRGLTEGQLARVRAILFSKRVRAGYVLMAENQAGELVYIVAQGSVKICTNDGNCDRVIAVRGPGEVLGEMSVLQGVGRSATVIAQEDSSLFWLNRADFWGVLWETPPIPYNFACLLSQRVRVLTSQVQSLTTLDVQGRLARQLVTLSEEYGQPCGAADESPNKLIPFQLKQAELGHMIGATREQVNKLLGNWTRRGLIARDGARIIVCQSEALRRLY